MSADLRLAAVGYRLATRNVALCDRVEPATGLVLHAIDQYPPSERAVVQQQFGFATSIGVLAIVPGSPAARGGLQANDAIASIGRVPAPAKPASSATIDTLVRFSDAVAALPPAAPMQVSAVRAKASVTAAITPTPACRTRFEVRPARDWEAAATGDVVQLSQRLVDAVPDDQLAAVVAHELAHNILRHAERLKAVGVSYGILSGIGGSTKYFRQTETEADILSVHLLANAGYDPTVSLRFWQWFGPKHASGLLRSRSHPAWRDRVTVMQREIAVLMMDRTMSAAPPILRRRAAPLDGNWQDLLNGTATFVSSPAATP